MRFFPLLPALILIAYLMTGPGCANIVPPGGGAKDTSAPRLLRVSPGDSLLNARPQKVELSFDEFVVLADPGTNVQISPLLEVPLTVTGNLKKVAVRIPDTLLRPRTTYRISFGTAIQDLHENNPFRNYTYVFSTGPYFDSLRLRGSVIDAATGLPDSAASVLLYDAAEGDSAVVRHKPLYLARAAGNGSFSFDGLPAGAYNLYALSDKNNNLTYDGNGEKIAFLNSSVMVTPDSVPVLKLYSFEEPADTSQAAVPAPDNNQGRKNLAGRSEGNASKNFSYSISADSSDLRKRTFDINLPLYIRFTRRLREFAAERIFLSYDSAGSVVETLRMVRLDTESDHNLVLTTNWQEDAVYTLRLQKGFAKDTTGADAMPVRFSFRTKRSEDYGRLQLHLPSRLYGKNFVLQVTREKDTLYQQPVTDTMVTFNRLAPGSYSFRVIHDANGNGKWDPGDLFLKKQPELVEPYPNVINLKAGWDNLIDFDISNRRKGSIGEGSAPPGTR